MLYATKIYFHLFLPVFLIGCDLLSGNEQESFIKLVPDNTLFVVSLLETSPDTIHHYPEVFVGRVHNVEHDLPFNPDGPQVEGIWWPVISAQVHNLCSRLNLVRIPESGALVSIEGPLQSEDQKKVIFEEEGNGVYGDHLQKLKLVPEGEYRLEVTLKGGSHYQAVTTLPELPIWEVPSSIEVELELSQFSNGNYFEKNKDTIKLFYEPAPSAPYTTGQMNYSDDWESFDVQKGKFLFEDRGNFLREGGNYFIQKNGFFENQDFYDPRWNGDESTPLKDSLQVWMYIAQLNGDMSERWFYQHIFNWIGMSSEDPWNDRDRELIDALVERDTTYLFDISNILKVDDNGKVLPKAQTDAIGVFGGYSAAYRTATVIPVRSWDPDTLNWGN